MSPVLAGRMDGENPILNSKLFHAPGNNSARNCLLPNGEGEGIEWQGYFRLEKRHE
jgi:hypothetical protein